MKAMTSKEKFENIFNNMGLTEKRKMLRRYRKNLKNIKDGTIKRVNKARIKYMATRIPSRKRSGVLPVLPVIIGVFALYTLVKRK